jgi:exopolysaccharide biosynthesis protein
MKSETYKNLCETLCHCASVVQLFCTVVMLCLAGQVRSQLVWKNVTSEFGPLPTSIQVFKSTDTIGGKPNIAYYVIADLKDKKLSFDTDTTLNRRLTPSEFYSKNNEPYVVVNGTFFSFETNRNLNVVVKDKKLVSYNIHTTPLRGKDTFTYRHTFHSAIGISKKRKADVAWLLTDSSMKYPYALQLPLTAFKDSMAIPDILSNYKKWKYSQSIHAKKRDMKRMFEKWKMQTAIGGGPVLVQGGQIKITNNEEVKFGGKAIDDRHPRTAMGYTADNKLVILVVQGRFPGVAEGASLVHLATILKDIGCVEGLNLDGGGSSCLLVNGKETIAPSDKKQRPVPAVFIIQKD